MRITNNIIMKNTKLNINSNKVDVDTLNTQMTTQKKIDRPSDDPVVAIRALRLRTSLNQINQYFEKNIPDAESWLEVTETALTNMRKILTDVHTQCVNGANDTLTSEDRNIILTQLQALSDQVYSEGNADYAGRTVFTGYKTDTTLTFPSREADTSYEINQYISADKVEEHRYSYAGLSTPTYGELANAITGGTVPDDPGMETVKRIRLAYDGLSDLNSGVFSYSSSAADGSVTTTTVTFKGDNAGNRETVTTSPDGTTTVVSTTASGFTYREMTTEELEEMKYAVGENEIIYNKATGELLLGDNVAKEINSSEAQVNVNYVKTGFSKGDLKPENYFDCINITDPQNPIEYKNFDDEYNFMPQEINYTVAANQTLPVNIIANNVFSSDIGRDVNELVTAVKASIVANDTVTAIKDMLEQEQYSSEPMQAKLKEYLAAAERQADFADDHMQKLFSQGLTAFSGYMEKVNNAITDVGNRGDRLSVIKTRMSNQQLTVKELRSTNEDKELSEIVIDYTAAYTAYQASLQAAAKLQKQTLLDYL